MPEFIPITLTPRSGICRFLRSKTGLGTTEGGADPWLLVDEVTAVSRCLRTMEAFGPDDEYADASVCRTGRACYAPADEHASPLD